jgi:hypothetical protein
LPDGRVALLGDAAFCPSPVAGGGSSLALIGAYVLAEELSRPDDLHTAIASPAVRAGMSMIGRRFGSIAAEDIKLPDYSPSPV